MKKLITLLLALCMVLSMTACGGAKDLIEEVVDEVTKDILIERTGFSITLPAYAVDASEEDTATVEPYLFTVGDIIVCAMEQPKEGIGSNMSPEEYAQLLVDTNGFDSVVGTKHGLPTFTFTKEEDDLTYLCVTMATDNALWFINASCAPEDFEKNEETMWKYLTSVQVTATGEPYVEETEPQIQAVVVDDLTVYMPADGYTDITGEVDGEFRFIFMPSDDMIVVGIRDDKASVETFESLEAYAQELILANGLDSQLEYRDGVPYFVYSSDDNQFTYLAAVHEGTNAYWFVQAYTFTENFAQLEDSLWQFVSTCSVA